ncbi:amidohydrolase family protein [Bradyrhizobium sp. CB2312]|uniref:amidohydrolase family protein n=1 Tax=Bradyrhizobium sp. CB2312 TaxID=3039155 RepID=UPI0024B2457B|nr:amidohydrolase family protein [Bradyrhizobium sp. CB2312]WFU71233.1 amidohydrolase family protein [Bradyrhizobium sp. CB2312]
MNNSSTNCNGSILQQAGAAVDCHVHVFDSSRDVASPRFPHPEEPASVAQLELVGTSCNIQRYVLTQPSFLGFDNSHLLKELALRPQNLRGVVWLDADTDPAALPGLAASGVAGLRFPMFYSREMPDWDAYADLVSAAASCGIHVELGLHGSELIKALHFVLKRSAKVVLAHLGMFDSEAGPESDPSFGALLDAAATRQVWVKLSAPYRTTALHAARACECLISTLGPERLVWGSDWPHIGAPLDRRAAYAETMHWLHRCVPEADLRRKILETSPATLYHFALPAGAE